VVILGLDPSGPDTARQEMIAIGLVGTTALVSGVLPGLYLAKSDSASRVGAIVYGVVSLLTIEFFWSGRPASSVPSPPGWEVSPAVELPSKERPGLGNHWPLHRDSQLRSQRGLVCRGRLRRALSVVNATSVVRTPPGQDQTLTHRSTGLDHSSSTMGRTRTLNAHMPSLVSWP
jgi:hypothetical protein